MKTGEKLALGGGVVLVGLALAVAAIAPTVVRTARRVSAPIERMERSEKALEELRAKGPWKRPEGDALSADQLDRFFAVRQRIDALRRRPPLPLEDLARRNPKGIEGLKEVPGILEGVSGTVSAELDAYVAGRMSPEEYRWIERLVYERWRGPLRRARTYPLAARDAAAEIDAAAARETDPRVRARLRGVAEALRGRVPAPPDGFDPQIHALLLTRLVEIERLSMDDLGHVNLPVPQ